MSCCDNIIMRMLPEPLPGVLCAELSDGSVVCFDRSYVNHCDPETRGLLQSGLMPQTMIDEYRRLKRRGDGSMIPFLTWPARDQGGA
jgi:hypothetical protein